MKIFRFCFNREDGVGKGLQIPQTIFIHAVEGAQETEQNLLNVQVIMSSYSLLILLIIRHIGIAFMRQICGLSCPVYCLQWGLRCLKGRCMEHCSRYLWNNLPTGKNYSDFMPQNMRAYIPSKVLGFLFLF